MLAYIINGVIFILVTLFWSKGSNLFGLRGHSELDFPGTVRSSYEDETPMTGTYSFSNGTLTIKDGNETYSMKVTVDNGILILERDYAEDCNNLELNKLIELGISDPANFQATKAIAKISFSRQ